MNSILEEFIPIVAILSAIALPVLSGAYLTALLLKSRHKERIGLIQQGIIPSSQPRKATPNKYVALRNGFLCVGIALGAIVGLVVNDMYKFQEIEFFITLITSILFFLGTAYILFYFATRNNTPDEEC